MTDTLCCMLYEPARILAEPLTLYIAAVGTAWSLLGSPRNGQAAFMSLWKTFALFSWHS